MEENVALDATKQKKFDKSIKGIKKLIKKKDIESKGDDSHKVKSGRVGKKKRPQRGLVYLSHIPHGFYENEMSQYFKQFGVVTNVRVIKSKRTGRSKGFAFVEFKEPAVAEIVADTMNNYLMGKRLIKAAYVPPEKQRRKVFRKRWNSVNNPGNNLRIKMKKAHNENKDDEGELQRARKLMTNINKTKKMLREIGINYDFFSPVDVPEELAKKVKIENEDNNKKVFVNDEKSKKRGKKVDVIVKKENPKDSKTNTKTADNKEDKKEKNKNAKIKNENTSVKQVEADKNTQKIKKQNLKDKGVAPPEEFITVNKESDNESDSSLEFDSDEFEKMLDDDDADSDMIDDDSEDDGSVSEEEDEVEREDSDEEPLPKQKGKNKSAPKTVPVPQLKKIVDKKGAQKRPQPQPQQPKKKATQNVPVIAASKKPKFEKQTNQKPKNKQFKKKK